MSMTDKVDHAAEANSRLEYGHAALTAEQSRRVDAIDANTHALLAIMEELRGLRADITCLCRIGPDGEPASLTVEVRQ